MAATMKDQVNVSPSRFTVDLAAAESAESRPVDGDQAEALDVLRSVTGTAWAARIERRRCRRSTFSWTRRRGWRRWQAKGSRRRPLALAAAAGVSRPRAAVAVALRCLGPELLVIPAERSRLEEDFCFDLDFALGLALDGGDGGDVRGSSPSLVRLLCQRIEVEGRPAGGLVPDLGRQCPQVQVPEQDVGAAVAEERHHVIHELPRVAVAEVRDGVQPACPLVRTRGRTSR